MSERSIQDRLREEYFDLLPEISLVANELEAKVRFHTLGISRVLERHEHLAFEDEFERQIQVSDSGNTPM